MYLSHDFTQVLMRYISSSDTVVGQIYAFEDLHFLSACSRRDEGLKDVKSL